MSRMPFAPRKPGALHNTFYPGGRAVSKRLPASPENVKPATQGEPGRDEQQGYNQPGDGQKQQT